MRSLTAITPLLLASTHAHAHVPALPQLSISKRDRHTGGATNHFARSIPLDLLQKRQDTVGSNIFNVLSWSTGGAYYANLTVGTPPQPQTVILDTGSSDLYFDASSASTCENPPSPSEACKGGTFDLSASSTYNEVSAAPAFNTTFGDGSTAIGPYGSDVLGFGNVELSPVQFGLATEVTSTTGFALGLLGLGYSNNEAVRTERNLYQNLPEVLKDAGVINSRLYSIFLNDADADTGTILFGGIDRSKYTGDLATVNFLPPVYKGQLLESLNFITTITAANVSVAGNTKTLWSGGSPDINAYRQGDAALPVLLDTGSTAWSMPADYFAEFIAPNFPFLDRNGLTSCNNVNADDTLSLEFAGKITITVPARQFIVPLIDSESREPVAYDRNSDACLFLITEQESDGAGFMTLGDAILRSMYVVFDLDNGQGSIAQAAVNTTAKPDIVIVEAGPSGVAKAVSNVIAAPAQTFSAPPEVSHATISYVVSTAASTVGSATGEAAVPEGAQVEDDDNDGQGSGRGGGSGSGSGSGSGGSSSSSAAASAVVVPGADYTGLWITTIWVAGMALGAGLMI